MGSEELSLRTLGPVRCDYRAMRGPKCEAPTQARVTSLNLKHDTIESNEVVFVTTEQLRLQNAVESGLAELHLHRLGMAATRIVLDLCIT